MLLTTGSRAAAAVQVQVTGVKALQVIEDVPLVPGKATVLRVDLTASAPTAATLAITFGASSKSVSVRLGQGPNTRYVPVDPPRTPGPVSFSASVTPGGGGSATGQAVVVALQRDHLQILFLPVDWTTQDRAKQFPARFNSFVASSTDFFQATYPLPASNITTKVSTVPFMLSPAQRAIVDAGGNLNWSVIVDMYSSIAVAGRQIVPSADLVVGILPPRWFARNLKDPSVVGLELHAVRAVVADQVDSDYATLAHETGHVFGRQDDYDFNQRPPKIGNRLDAAGYWASKGQVVMPGNQPVYYSFMGAQDAGSQAWVDRATYLAILQMLESGTSLGP
jgi:hypothetical protein